jgi:ParB family chromosome partitioning protein
MSSNSKKQPALGRGLSALLQNSDTDITSMSGATVGSVSMIDIQLIEANPFNPRTHFEKDALEELRLSIVTHGIIQPLTVRKLGRDRYQLISGERRFRASQLAGLTEVPAYIRIANDQTMLEMALVENIQREDLNAIEVAISYERLISECKLTQEQLSEKVAKSRSHIANHIRLLKLPAVIQAGVRDQVISMGHARALLSITNESEQLAAYQQIIDDSLSVRAIEQLVKPTTSTIPTKAKSEKVSLTSTESVFASFLSDKLGTKVTIDKSDAGKGKVQVHFKSEAELNRVMALLNK